MTQHVFVSYSKADQECAYQMVERMESQGILCWIAPRDIAPSADWAAEIIDAISTARIMVVVFSASSNQSSQVRREIERAVHKDVSILPFRIDDVTPSKSLEYFLSAQHWLDAFVPPREQHYARLCQYVNQVLQKDPFSQTQTQIPIPPLAAPAPPPTPPTPIAPIAPADLKLIEARLAAHIGPMAQMLVKRAAARAGSPKELVALLAGEIEVDAERRVFSDACKALLRQYS